MYHIYGVDPGSFAPTRDSVLRLVHPDDRAAVAAAMQVGAAAGYPIRIKLRTEGWDHEGVG